MTCGFLSSPVIINRRESIFGGFYDKNIVQTHFKILQGHFVLAIAGVAVGVLVGLVDAAFGLGLNACTAIRTKYFWYLIWFLPLGGVFIWFIYHQFWQICRQWYEDGLSRRPW